jgi:hypothetical protein
MMLEAAAKDDRLAAVVSEGAGARAYADAVDIPGSDPVGRGLGVIASAVKTGAVSVFANQTPPHHLETYVGRIAPRPLMLIAAPNSGHGEELNRRYERAAGEPTTLWEIPEARHMGGMSSRPAEYERRVVGFFDRALRP